MAEGVERRFAAGSAGVVIEPELGVTAGVRPKVGIHVGGYTQGGQ